ncbi:MAG: carbohydrate ABC transporter permease [Limnochordia bacterium]
MSIQTRLGNPHVTQAAKVTSAVLIVLGILLVVVGVFGYLMGDLNYEPLQPIAKEVYSARREARTEERAITGTVDLLGEGRGTVPMRLVSLLMDSAILVFLVGIFFVFNGIMLRIQSWERMKDMFTVQPAVFFFLLFVYYPVIDLVRISFTDMRMLVADPQPFIGLKNYEWLFLKSGWKIFKESLFITMTYTFWELVITLAGGMLLALLFNRMSKAFHGMRTIVFMPKYIAVSTSAIVFIWILNGNYGILNYVLSLFGFKGPNWLVDAKTALTGVLILTAWRVVGYAMMIYLSAMQGIPKDYYEAAAIDGADAVQRFRFITIPMLAPTTLFLFVTTFIASMKVFQSVDVMTGGGPGRATNVLVQWIYNLSFSDYRAGRSAAVSVVFFIILLVCTAATMRWSNRSVSYDS